MDDPYNPAGRAVSIPGSGISPVIDAARFSDQFAPVSLAKIVILLEQELGAQGPASALISRSRFYQEIECRSDEILNRVGERRDAYANAHGKFTRRASSLDTCRTIADLVQGAGSATVVVIGVWLGVLYIRHIVAPHLLVPLFWVAVVAAIAAGIPAGLYGRTVKRLVLSTQASASALYEQLGREFHLVMLDLLTTTAESRLDPVLVSEQAPTLVETESNLTIPSETFRNVNEFLQRHDTSAVGLAGPRGAGKSTLLRWLVHHLDGDWMPVYLTAPAAYDATDFLRVIFSETVSTIISRHQANTTRWGRGWLAQIINDLRALPPANDIVANSYLALEMLTGTRTSEKKTTAGLSGKGVTLQKDRQTSWAERERTHPELTAAFKRYLEDYQRLGGRRVIIAVDELDKLTSAEEAIAAINGLKDLFHLSHTHFVVSVSEDALRRFAMRGIPVRDVFDSAFDEIVRVQPPSPEDAWKMLNLRVDDFPMSIALFCYAWAGGLPRDTIRTARACVAERRRRKEPVSVVDVAPVVVRQDVAAAIDAAIGACLDGAKGMDIGTLTQARRSLSQPEPGLRRGLLKCADADDAVTWHDDLPHGVMMQQGLSVYADLGVVVTEYFREDFDAQLAATPDAVLTEVANLARVRAELGSYPPEARWRLDQAQAARPRE